MPVMGHLQFNQPTTSVVGLIQHQKIINRFNGLKPLKWFIEFHIYVLPRINPWAKLQPNGRHTLTMDAAHREEKHSPVVGVFTNNFTPALNLSYSEIEPFISPERAKIY